MSGSDADERDQLRLHAWPDWDESIEAARHRLGFDPAWTPRPGADQPPLYRQWRETLELRRLLAEARRALTELHLPERFADYWLACFLAPYERDGFAVILDPQPTGDIRPTRVFPPPMALWFDAGIDYSTAPATLVIEGPAALASTTVLRAAVRRALAAKQKAGFPTQHPLAHARQIGPVLAERAAARASPDPARTNAMRHARAWRDDGEKPGFIASRLGQWGYRVSERQVRRWLDAPASAKSDTPFGQDDAPTSKS